MGSITYNASFYLTTEPLKTDYALLTTRAPLLSKVMLRNGICSGREMAI